MITAGPFRIRKTYLLRHRVGIEYDLCDLWINHVLDDIMRSLEIIAGKIQAGSCPYCNDGGSRYWNQTRLV